MVDSVEHGIRIRVDLSAFYSDHRKQIMHYVPNTELSVSSIKKKISSIYHLPSNVRVFIDDYFLHSDEPVKILKNGDILRIKPKPDNAVEVNTRVKQSKKSDSGLSVILPAQEDELNSTSSEKHKMNKHTEHTFTTAVDVSVSSGIDDTLESHKHIVQEEDTQIPQKNLLDVCEESDIMEVDGEAIIVHRSYKIRNSKKEKLYDSTLNCVKQDLYMPQESGGQNQSHLTKLNELVTQGTGIVSGTPKKCERNSSLEIIEKDVVYDMQVRSPRKRKRARNRKRQRIAPFTKPAVFQHNKSHYLVEPPARIDHKHFNDSTLGSDSSYGTVGVDEVDLTKLSQDGSERDHTVTNRSLNSSNSVCVDTNSALDALLAIRSPVRFCRSSRVNGPSKEESDIEEIKAPTVDKCGTLSESCQSADCHVGKSGFVFEVVDASSDEEEKLMEHAQEIINNYHNYPLSRQLPKENDIILYKILELGENYTPTISTYKEARVLKLNAETGKIVLRIYSGVVEKKRGKFDIDDQDEDKTVTVDWSDLMETRLVFP